MSIEETLLINPYLIDESSAVINIALDLLPRDTGIEIECDKAKDHDLEPFKLIGLVDVNVDSSEQRFRLKPGIDGLKSLHALCQLLSQYCLLTKAGIHYHVGFDSFPLLTDEIMKANKDWMLAELDSWPDKGTYNKRNFTFNKCNWIRGHETYKTLEYRIGEMTFDYRIIVQRIIHCQSLTTRLDFKLGFNKELIELESKIIELHECKDNIEQLINNRIIRI